MWCKIELDDQKIAAKGEYTADSIHSAISRTFDQRGIRETSPYTWTGYGDGRDFGLILGTLTDLAKTDWFVSSVKSCLWYNGEDSPSDIIDEILLDHERKLIPYYG